VASRGSGAVLRGSSSAWSSQFAVAFDHHQRVGHGRRQPEIDLLPWSS